VNSGCDQVTGGDQRNRIEQPYPGMQKLAAGMEGGWVEAAGDGETDEHDAKYRQFGENEYPYGDITRKLG
jgi:hypothetical protein